MKIEFVKNKTGVHYKKDSEVMDLIKAMGANNFSIKGIYYTIWGMYRFEIGDVCFLPERPDNFFVINFKGINKDIYSRFVEILKSFDITPRHETWEEAVKEIMDQKF